MFTKYVYKYVCSHRAVTYHHMKEIWMKSRNMSFQDFLVHLRGIGESMDLTLMEENQVYNDWLYMKRVLR